MFVKAISTIRTLSTRTGYGSLPRPPLENRIKLYGLYKQSTEGDLRNIPNITRPVGTTPSDENAQRKFDAWKQQEGLSKTQAKRLYISFLISTMKVYGSGTMEARELLSELEFLWDQIKDVNPSEGSDGSMSRSVSRTGNRLPSNNVLSFNSSTLVGGNTASKNGSFLESYIQEGDAYESLKFEVREANRQLARVLHQLNAKKAEAEDEKSYKVFRALMRFLSGSVSKIIYELIIVIIVLKVYKTLKRIKNWERLWRVYSGYFEKVVDFLI